MSQPSLESVMRVRRQQPTRLEGFVDASFAFAVTLIVISIGHVPGSVSEMLLALRGLPTFAVSFLLVARIWHAHRGWSRYYDLEDTRSIVLSLVLVFVMLIYVYPLRILFAQMFLGFSGHWLSDGTIAPITTVEELRAAYTVFGFGLGAIACVFILLYRHALANAANIGLGEGEKLITRMKLFEWYEQLSIAAVSVACAQWMPMASPLAFSLPGFLYGLSSLTGPVTRRHFRRRLALLGDA
ncbi:MAG: TMEM175 family protein [Rudaea sp.]